MVITCTRKFGELLYIGEDLSCTREVENYRDLFAVAVVRSGVIVGHVQRKVCSMFLRRGGTISCRAAGMLHRLSLACLAPRLRDKGGLSSSWVNFSELRCHLALNEPLGCRRSSRFVCYFPSERTS